MPIRLTLRGKAGDTEEGYGPQPLKYIRYTPTPLGLDRDSSANYARRYEEAFGNISLGKILIKKGHTASPTDVDPRSQVSTKSHGADLGSIGSSKGLEDYYISL
jgi:hypothetical protein